MNLFEKLQLNKITPLLERKKGHFVVDENNGIALLVASNYKKNKGSYLLITSNLFKAQKLYSSLVSFLSKDDVLLFPCDELIRAETIAESKEMSAHRLYVLDEILKSDFMNMGKSIPKTMPQSTLACPPTINYIKESKIGEKSMRYLISLIDSKKYSDISRFLFTNSRSPFALSCSFTS